jgi:hypothetical protein
MSLKDDYKNWLSLGFLKSTANMSTLYKLSFEDFNSSERALMSLYKIGHEWYEAHKKPVPLEHIQQVFEHELMKNSVLNEMEMMEFVNLVTFVYETSKSPIDQLDSYIADILSAFIEERQVRPLLQKATQSNNLPAAIHEVREALKKSQVVRAASIDPFAFNLPITSPEKKVRWNCDFIDAITGGAVRGETTLLLAPSGGGKTLSNIQIACSSALAGEHAMVFSYEQAVIPGLTNRIYSYVLGKEVSYFQGLSEEEIADVMRKDKQLANLWERQKSRLEGKLHLVDMLKAKQEGGGCGGVEEIANCIKRLQDSGKNPRYVGLDWFGPFIDNYMTSGKFAGKRGGAPKHEIMSAAANDLRIMGTELGVNLFIYHQLGTSAAIRKPIDIPMATDAHECKTLHHYMDSVICIGNRTPFTNLAFVHVPKQRNSTPHLKACIQMDGAHSRWKYISDKVVDDGNGGIMIPGMNDLEDGAFEDTGGGPNLVKAADYVKSPTVIGFMG